MREENFQVYIPFNKPYTTGKEFEYIREAINNLHLSGDGVFTKKCHTWLEKQTGCKKALLTHSCTAALEMAAILANIKPGDEIIIPSYTFVSTVNAFVLRGAVPVFIDICKDTLNIDSNKIESAITDKTKAIIPVHYAGVACEMDKILDIAKKYNLLVIEDAAQSIICTYKCQPLGSLGHMSTLSFHETKNIHSGEGGALLINDKIFIERAEIIREKGTNRSKFFRGEIDKYTWVDIGSSFLPSDITAAFLLAQMEQAEEITEKRLKIWNNYHNAFEELEKAGKIRRPVVPLYCKHNAHMYYILLPDEKIRNNLILKLKEKGINSIFHYIPLHSSPAGKQYGKYIGTMNITENISNTVLRLPLWIGMDEETEYVIKNIHNILHYEK